jgi:hypothetical protein
VCAGGVRAWMDWLDDAQAAKLFLVAHDAQASTYRDSSGSNESMLDIAAKHGWRTVACGTKLYGRWSTDLQYPMGCMNAPFWSMTRDVEGRSEDTGG